MGPRGFVRWAVAACAVMLAALVAALAMNAHRGDAAAPQPSERPGLSVQVLSVHSYDHGVGGQKPNDAYVVFRVKVTGYGHLDPERFTAGGYAANYDGAGATQDLLAEVDMHGKPYVGDVAFDAPPSVAGDTLQYR